MERENRLTLKPAMLSDAEAMHRMQVTAFAPMLAKYNDFAISPAAETVERVREKIAMPDSRYYFILADGRAVGGIRVVDHRDPERRKIISPLFILAEYRNRGYARRAIALAEQRHGQHFWALDTIAEEPANCHLYEKMGYHRVGTSRKVRPNMTIVDYEKN
ncbi:MAG: GNAT family N-acetyltransferase [bacterium]